MNRSINTPTDLPEQYMDRKITKYPFKNMEIGDWFIICEKYSRLEMMKAGNTARNWARKSKYCKRWKFSVKKTDDGKILIKRVKNRVIKRKKSIPKND